MKYIEKERLVAFLKLKGYRAEQDYSEEQKNRNTCWQKSENEKVTVPAKEIFPSNDLPDIFFDKDLLNEFRKF